MATTRTKLTLAILATGILAIGALAVSVDAKPGDQGRPDGQDRARPCDHPANETAQERCDQARKMQQDRQDMRADRRDLRQDRRELRDDVKAFCDKAAANSTAAKRCEHLKDAVKARRVAHALLTAIRVHERELGRVTFRIHELEQQMNGTAGNATAQKELQARIGHLQDRQQKLIEKIAAEKAKLQTLHDKWAEVADHLRDRKEKGEDDGGVGEDGAPAVSTSASATGNATA